MKRGLYGAFILLVLAALLYLAELRNPEEKQNPGKTEIVRYTSEQSGFIVGVGVPKAIFGSKEMIPLVIYVKNVGSETSSLFFVTSQKYDINIKDAGGHEVWSWAKGRVFTMAIEEMQIEPGRQETFSYLWNQMNADNNPVPPGRYVIEALCTSKQTAVPAGINIEIQP